MSPVSSVLDGLTKVLFHVQSQLLYDHTRLSHTTTRIHMLSQCHYYCHYTLSLSHTTTHIHNIRSHSVRITVITCCHCHLAVTRHDMHTHHTLSQCHYYSHYILSLSLGCHTSHTCTLSSFVTTIRDLVFDPSPYPNHNPNSLMSNKLTNSECISQ